MKLPLFEKPWYHEMISAVLESNGKASPDAALQAAAIMTAGAFIAEAISHAFDQQSDTESVHTALQELAAATANIGDALNQIATQVEVRL